MESLGISLPEPFIARVLTSVFSALAIGESENIPIAAPIRDLVPDSEEVLDTARFRTFGC